MFTSLEEEFLSAFDQKIHSNVRLNVIFAFAIILEFILIILFFPFFIKSAFLAFILGGFILTIFAFLMSGQYFSSCKHLFFQELVKTYLDKTKTKLNYSFGVTTHHLALAKACTMLAETLYAKEYQYYPPPPFLKRISRIAEKLSCILHWKDLFITRELLLNAVVKEHLALIKIDPTNPETHGLLANAYVLLSGLYVDPRCLSYEEDERWFPKERFSEEIKLKFQEYAKKAIEEFKILKEYAPHDPWIYAQLAYSYRDLNMLKEEREAYETLLKLRPDEQEIRHKLGQLYFKNGEMSKGLKIYEELKQTHYPKADELLDLYVRGT